MRVQTLQTFTGAADTAIGRRAFMVVGHCLITFGRIGSMRRRNRFKAQFSFCGANATVGLNSSDCGPNAWIT
jgi:hypothetical protein